jgi:single-strand DNA-binding protein
MARSLNKVQLIGNLTRDPEMRYTPQGTAVCTFGVATNRSWTTESGEKKEAADFHNIVAWNKLAEICAQLLKKGRKVYVEGRLSTRSWQGQDGVQRQRTEIVISDMIILDRKGEAPEEGIAIPEPGMEPQVAPEEVATQVPTSPAPPKTSRGKGKKGKKTSPAKASEGEEKKVEEPAEEDIPF